MGRVRCVEHQVIIVMSLFLLSSSHHFKRLLSSSFSHKILHIPSKVCATPLKRCFRRIL